MDKIKEKFNEKEIEIYTAVNKNNGGTEKRPNIIISK